MMTHDCDCEERVTEATDGAMVPVCEGYLRGKRKETGAPPSSLRMTDPEFKLLFVCQRCQFHIATVVGSPWVGTTYFTVVNHGFDYPDGWEWDKQTGLLCNQCLAHEDGDSGA